MMKKNLVFVLFLLTFCIRYTTKNSLEEVGKYEGRLKSSYGRGKWRAYIASEYARIDVFGPFNISVMSSFFYNDSFMVIQGNKGEIYDYKGASYEQMYEYVLAPEDSIYFLDKYTLLHPSTDTFILYSSLGDSLAIVVNRRVDTMVSKAIFMPPKVLWSDLRE